MEKAFGIRLLALCAALFFVCVWTMPAQNLRRITTQDGLSGSAVTSICQSDDGLIWVGTLDGIYVFFGGKALRPSTGKYFQGEIIERILTTYPLDMWIQTTHGLYKIDRLAETEEKLETFPQFSGSDIVRTVSTDRLAVLDATSRIQIYNPSLKCFEELVFPMMKGEKILDFGGSDDFLWAVGNNGIYRCNLISEGENESCSGEATVCLMDGPVKFCAPTDNPEVLHVLDEANRLYLLDIRQNTKTFVLQLDNEVNFRGQPSGIVESNGAYYISYKVHGVVKCTFDTEVNPPC